MTKLRAISYEAARICAHRLMAAGTEAEYGYECDDLRFRWYVYIY